MLQRRLSSVSTSVAIAMLSLAVLSLAPVRQSRGGAEPADLLVAMFIWWNAAHQDPKGRERGMGYVTIPDGKISLINFVSIPDDPAPAATRTP